MTLECQDMLCLPWWQPLGGPGETAGLGAVAIISCIVQVNDYLNLTRGKRGELRAQEHSQRWDIPQGCQAEQGRQGSLHFARSQCCRQQHQATGVSGEGERLELGLEVLKGRERHTATE